MCCVWGLLRGLLLFVVGVFVWLVFSFDCLLVFGVRVCLFGFIFHHCNKTFKLSISLVAG